jgi:hypothetical protein
MRFERFSFGQITIDGVTYEHDIVIDHGEIRKRIKKPSKKLREAFAHTPLSAAEEIPWKCRRLVIGTGAYGSGSSQERTNRARVLAPILGWPCSRQSSEAERHRREGNDRPCASHTGTGRSQARRDQNRRCPAAQAPIGHEGAQDC